MSTLMVKFTKIDEIKEHPNADRLSVARIGGWQVVIKKDTFKVGDNIIFIPPDAIVSQKIHEYLGITNYLAELPKGYGGLPETERPTDMRVKAARLRGEPSYGTIMTPVDATILAGYDNDESFKGWDTVDNIAEALGITKWEPPIKEIQGDMDKDVFVFSKYTNIENWRNYPDMFKQGEKVVVTEKIHGQNFRVGYIREPGEIGYKLVAGSHNTVRRQYNDEGQVTNFWKPLEWYPNLEHMMKKISKQYQGENVIVFGEIFGSGVQDMNYGMTNGKKDVRVFDILVKNKYLDYPEKMSYCKEWDIPMVPLLWSGPYSKEKIEELTDGKTIFDAKTGFTGREGIVITPVFEREEHRTGRVILKSISADYLARKGGTDSH